MILQGVESRRGLFVLSLPVVMVILVGDANMVVGTPNPSLAATHIPHGRERSLKVRDGRKHIWFGQNTEL